MVTSEIYLTTQDYSKSKMGDGVEEESYRGTDEAATRAGARGSTIFIRHAPRKSAVAEQEHPDDDWSQRRILGEDNRNEDEGDDTQSIHGNGIRRVVEFQVRSAPASDAES